MSAERIVIIGAGPAGFATARAYRESGGEGSVTLLGAEPLLPYERPPLTKELARGELDPEQLPLAPREWFDTHDVELRRGVAATAIDADARIVTLESGRPIEADAIVLATGSEPVRPEVPGMDHPEVMTMRTLSDSIGVSRRVRDGVPAVVIGTGFVGCELAASLAMRGAKVTLIGEEMLPQLARLGEDAARRIAGWLGDLGVTLIGEATVSAVEGGRTVELDGEASVSGSVIVLGTGVRPRGELAQHAGLRLKDGAAVVDQTMRSAGGSGGILAVGDVACAYNTSAGRHLHVEHWGDALEHGRVAGATLAGGESNWEQVPGFWSTIGRRTLKYAAWEDGHDEIRLDSGYESAFTLWYSLKGVAVGVLTHDRDEDYERGRKLIRNREPAP